MIRLLLIAAIAVVVSWIGYYRVCLEFGDGTVICGPFQSPVSPVGVVYREWLPVVWK